MIVEGGYNLPEGTPVNANAEKEAPDKVADKEAPDKVGSARRPADERHRQSRRPQRRPARQGINLVALAKPYFGLIVLTTALLTAFGVISMLRMPSGIYPEVAFPRIVVIAQSPGLAVKDVEVAVTRPIEEAVSIVLGVIRVRSKSVRGAAELSIDFAPGTDMIQALNDIRARMAEVGAQLPGGHDRRSPSDRLRRSFPSSRSS